MTKYDELEPRLLLGTKVVMKGIGHHVRINHCITSNHGYP